MNLESNIKYQLNEIKERKNTLISESKYVLHRLENLIENTDFNNKTDILIFRGELIKEMRILRENNLLNEQPDMSGLGIGLGFLAKKVGKSLWDMMFKKFYAQIAESLGFDSNSFMFKVIVNAIQFMEWSDMSKILGGDCDLLVRKLSTAIISSIREKIQARIGMGGTGNELIGMTLTQAFVDDENSAVAKAIQQNISPIVCRKMEEWLGKAEQKGLQAKKEAEGTKKSEPSAESKPGFMETGKATMGL